MVNQLEIEKGCMHLRYSRTHIAHRSSVAFTHVLYVCTRLDVYIHTTCGTHTVHLYIYVPLITIECLTSCNVQGSWSVTEVAKWGSKVMRVPVNGVQKECPLSLRNLYTFLGDGRWGRGGRECNIRHSNQWNALGLHFPWGEQWQPIRGSSQARVTIDLFFQQISLSLECASSCVDLRVSHVWTNPFYVYGDRSISINLPIHAKIREQYRWTNERLMAHWCSQSSKNTRHRKLCE